MPEQNTWRGEVLNQARQAKKGLGLSGRQLKKLRKQAAREQRAQVNQNRSRP